MGHAKWVNSMDKFKNKTKQKIRTQSWVSQKKKGDSGRRWGRDEYDQNITYEILKDLINKNTLNKTILMLDNLIVRGKSIRQN